MPQLILTSGNLRKNFVNKFLRKFEPGPYFLLFSLIGCVALVTVITLMFSARQVTKGYVLNELEDTHQTLLRLSERKDMEISQVRALKYIEESNRVRRMVKPGQVVFVDGETAIAAK